MDIIPLNNSQTWTLQADSERGAKFLGFDYPRETEREFPAAEARELCKKARAAGLKVGVF
jgi:hypothetical protein